MKLTTGMRNALPSSAFALPGGRFPIEDPTHARAALSMAHNVNPAQQAIIHAKIRKKFPSIDPGMSMKDALVKKLGGGMP